MCSQGILPADLVPLTAMLSSYPLVVFTQLYFQQLCSTSQVLNSILLTKIPEVDRYREIKEASLH